MAAAARTRAWSSGWRGPAIFSACPASATRTPDDFFDRLEADAGNLATIEGELYFEYHRGTYTSQSEVKRLNRLAEGRLQELEYVATARGLAGLEAPSRAAVEALWRVLLVNQFHDILPGSSIAEVYERTREELTDADRRGERTDRSRLLQGLGGGVAAAPTPVNTIGFARAEVAAKPGGDLVFVEAAPFSAGRLSATDDRVSLTRLEDGGLRLENGQLTAVLTGDGAVASLIHRQTGREALSGEANRFVLFDDRPTAYEAWDIDPFALETGRETGGPATVEVVSEGPLRAEVRFERAIGKASRLTQTIRLDAASGALVFDTTIDWRDRRTLLKAVFPIACQAPRATYETMFGAVERPTHASTDADAAQYEVPGHRWADLSEPGFGVSLLSDSRYGYSTFGNVMGLSLLRGTMSPDRMADIGVHRFAYALYPHAGDWRDAGTVAEAAQFNRPLLWMDGAPADVLDQPLASAAPGERRGRHDQAGRGRRWLDRAALREPWRGDQGDAHLRCSGGSGSI